ncbi:hypothetical protein VIGAN_08287400 [Vigna angularis var. angularis]|uniref:Uncharacterized protein n=1 Tax=Vigna angularis var. angularis TaxID=157739 RepID=A0A0S3ST36_PHAAN|nr:hypothetical protein VIGAN_08287400 [Vigna angularis var. angularis]
MAPGLKPLWRSFPGRAIMLVSGKELGFEGTVWEGSFSLLFSLSFGGFVVKEHTGNGVAPHKPSLPEKAVIPNFFSMGFGKRP